VAIANAGCFEQRLELRRVEKADVTIDAVRLRLLGEPARVLVRPTLADREVEDPVQKSKVVVRALDRVLGKALLDESSMSSTVISDTGVSPKCGAR